MERATVSDTSSRVLPAQRSPFDGHKPGQRLAPDGQVGVVLHAATLPGLLQIHTWQSGIDMLRSALAAALDVAGVPAHTGQVVALASGLLMCTGPTEYLLLPAPGTEPGAQLRRQVTAEIGAVTDLGHARCRIQVEGARCRDALSKLFALDLREAAWPVGELRLTGHHHVPCAAYRTGRDRFELMVFSTYAFDQLGTLLDAALEYGVALELPGVSMA
jgi:heterotetrameric sarcosine oxidase gamma subunit